MKKNLAISLLSSAMFFAFASISVTANDMTEVHAVVPQDMLSILQADNVAQVRLRQVEDSGEDNPYCGSFHCEKAVSAIAARFSQLVLSEGAYLEISSVSDKEILRFDAREIAIVTARHNGIFTTPYVKGDVITLRIVYPPGQQPAATDKALLANKMTRVKVIQPGLAEIRRPAACLQDGDSAEQQAYARSQAIGYMNGTGWLVGTGNYLLTNAHVMGRYLQDGGYENKGDFIPERSVRFNYVSPDCADNSAAEARDNIVNIRIGQLLASGEANNNHDWTLFTLDPTEYREAGIKSIFGGLALDSNDVPLALPITAIGHGRYRKFAVDTNVADPSLGNAKHFSEKGQDGNLCSVIAPALADVFMTNCYLTGGNSGSPAFSATGKAIGLMFGSSSYDAYGIKTRYLLPLLAPWATSGSFTTAVTGSGKVRAEHVVFPAFASSHDVVYPHSNLAFAPVVAGRQFIHQVGYSQLKSIARDNNGNEADVLFRLVQSNACGESNLATVCPLPGATTLKIWLDRADNSALSAAQSVAGWLPVAVSANGELIANQMLRYRYTPYDPQTSPFDASLPVVKQTLNNETQYVSVFHSNDFRSGMTAVRYGEGPLTDNMAMAANDGVAWSGMSELSAEVINQQDGRRYMMKLRGGLINSCTAISVPVGNWTPMNSAACEQARPGTQSFTDGSVYLLAQDNLHLPAGRYTGMLPLMIRHWDKPEAAQAVELAIDYQIR